MVLKVAVVVTALNILAAGAFFGLHTIRQHPRGEAGSVWTVTVGTNMGGYTPVRDEQTVVLDPRRTFWEETLLVSVFAAVNLLVLIGFVVLGSRH